MRFMIVHKTNAHWESGASPEAGLIARVGKMIGEMAQAGVLQAAQGLRATSQGARLHFAGGRRTVTKGPFAGSNELPAGFVILKASSLDEAIEWGTRFAAVLGDPETGALEMDIRPVTEPWDIGMGTKPAGMTTRRYMVMHKADSNSEAGTMPATELMAAMGKLIQEMTQAGVLLTAEGVQPSSRGARLRYIDGKPTITDGPFAESKELIGGYVIVQAKSLQEALEWLKHYAEVVGAEEVDALALSG